VYFGNSVRIFGLGIAASVFRKIISVNQGSSTVEKLEFPSFFLASETVMPERACLRETAVFMTADQMQTTKTETVQSRLVATARTFSCASLADSRDRPLTRLIAGTDPSHDDPDPSHDDPSHDPSHSHFASRRQSRTQPPGPDRLAPPGTARPATLKGHGRNVARTRVIMRKRMKESRELVPRCFRWIEPFLRAHRMSKPGESPAGTTENSPAIYRWAQSRRPGSPAGTKECPLGRA